MLGDFETSSRYTSPFWILLELRMTGGGGDNWSYKMCKASVKSSSPPTNQHPAFYGADAFSVTQPTVSKHWREMRVCV